MLESARPTRVLFVCMGNLCRSPLAECVFRHKMAARGVDGAFELDSAGTSGWHAGEPPDHRIRAVAEANGVTCTGTARQVKREDFQHFDQIICMDEDNREDLLAFGAPPEKVRLLLECDPDAPVREVPDPYYGGADGFALVFRLLDSACEALLNELLAGGAEAE